MGKKIFQYELADAWEDTISKIEVYDNNIDNVVCVYPCVNAYTNEEIPEGRIYTIGEEQLKKIKTVLLKNIDIFQMEEVEHPFLMIDGFINCFYFSISGLEKVIRASNLEIFREQDAVNAKKVLRIFDEIVSVLREAKIDEKYLSLGLK